MAETEHTGKGNPLDGSLSGDGERGWVGGHAAPRGSSAVSAWRSTASGRGAPRETVRCPPRQLVSQEGLEGPLEARTTRQRKPALQHITSGTRSSSSSSSGGYPTHL